jgi:predicted transcriptional regulator
MFGTILPRSPYDRFCMTVDDGGAGDGGSGGGGSGSGEGSGSGRTFTQDDLNQTVQDRLAREKRTMTENIAKELGMSLDEAKAYIAERKKKDDEAKDEITKLRESAEADKAEAERIKGEARTQVLTTQIERALLRAGVEVTDDDAGEERLGRLSKLVDVDTDADSKAIKAAVDKLKKDEPALFGKNGTGKAPPSDPDGKPTRSVQGQDAFDRGKQRAEQYAKSSTRAGAGTGLGGYDL